MEIDDELPLCLTCNHRHYDGVKCSICGHIGKSNIFIKMQAKARANQIVNIEVLDKSQLLKNLALQLLMEDMLSPNSLQISDNKFYFYCKVGDMITGLAIIEYQTLLIVSEATVSNFVISPDYRMKGFGKQMLIKIIDYIRSHNSVVNSLVIPISESMESWLQEKLIKNGFNLNQLTNTLNLIIS